MEASGCYHNHHHKNDSSSLTTLYLSDDDDYHWKNDAMMNENDPSIPPYYFLRFCDFLCSLNFYDSPCSQHFFCFADFHDCVKNDEY
mmetsp:Transcript_2968/g.4537  ORF Transcript_2968/g.4537 Transcript_2968/m.4537 type:complete len:87 (-) Transcript_2968:1589-1849(-)